MRRVNESKTGLNTIMAFSLIPLSGFAMDVFIPSLPDMAKQLNASASSIQLSLSIFIISYGISQVLVGGLIDSYGRYRPGLISLLLFSASSFIIAYTHNLQVIYWMRAFQGLTAAIIVISKRAYFVDMFTGERLKKYTSLFSIIWAIAPIVAPFLGGFFQTQWGWTSNFMFLGYFGLVFFVIEFFVGGESLKIPQPFRARPILDSYASMIKTNDFASGVVILGLTYGMVFVYGMASPFLIENKLHLSPSVTGYCSLFSGVSVLIGGTISRMLIQKPFFRKLVIANSVQLLALAVILPLTLYYQNLVTLFVYIFVVHSLSGFIFNSLLSYCLIRFPQHAGKASGLTGGGFSVVTAFASSALVNTITISNQALLGLTYGILSLLVFVLLVRTRWQDSKKEEPVRFAVERSQRLVASRA